MDGGSLLITALQVGRAFGGPRSLLCVCCRCTPVCRCGASKQAGRWICQGALCVLPTHFCVLLLGQVGANYTSGRITSKPGGSWYPGMQLPDGSTVAGLHVEASIQVPQPGQGLWGAFWMLPAELKYGGWPASGEVRGRSAGAPGRPWTGEVRRHIGLARWTTFLSALLHEMRPALCATAMCATAMCATLHGGW